MTTHYEGCYNAGPQHYECALREIERLREKSNAADKEVSKLQSVILELRDLYREALREAEKLRATQQSMSQKLRPMSEAPRDGTALLLFAKEQKYPFMGAFCMASKLWRDFNYHPIRADLLGWLPLPRVEL